MFTFRGGYTPRFRNTTCCSCISVHFGEYGEVRREGTQYARLRMAGPETVLDVYACSTSTGVASSARFIYDTRRIADTKMATMRRLFSVGTIRPSPARATHVQSGKRRLAAPQLATHLRCDLKVQLIARNTPSTRIARVSILPLYSETLFFSFVLATKVLLSVCSLFCLLAFIQRRPLLYQYVATTYAWRII